MDKYVLINNARITATGIRIETALEGMRAVGVVGAKNGG